MRLSARSLSHLTVIPKIGVRRMWTEEHRARHDPRLKQIISIKAVAQIARWLKPADPPRSGRATPYVALVRAIAWHLRVGGSWRALPGAFPAWRTV